MTEYLIVYTLRRNGKPHYLPVTAETPAAAAGKFLGWRKNVYVTQVYAPVEWKG